MAFSIRTTLDRIVTIQSGLTITSPGAQSISRAYKYPPPAKTGLDFPCFMNWPELTQYDRGMLRQRIYQIRMQLFVKDLDSDVAGDIAVAFGDKLAIALDNDLTLSIAGVPSCTLWRDLRGGVRLLSWNGLDYIGLDLFMDVVLGGEIPGT
jgi:hypothetical protein